MYARPPEARVATDEYTAPTPEGAGRAVDLSFRKALHEKRLAVAIKASWQAALPI